MTQIPAKTTSRLLDSVAFMNSQHGVAFNGMITVNFDQLGLDGHDQASEAMTSLNEAIARKLKRFSGRWGVPSEGEHYFLYAHERCYSFGRHVHELIVLPHGLRPEFGSWLQAWSRRRYGNSTPSNAVHIRAAARPRTLDQSAETQARLVRYVLKTTEPAGVRARSGETATLHDLIGLKKERRSAPFIVPRIAGASENISFRAQARAGYQPREHFEDLLSWANLHEFAGRQRQQAMTDHLRALDL